MIVKEANKSVLPGSPIYDDVVAYVKKHRRDPSLSDFFSALTKNRIKGTFGHTNSYYKNYRVRASKMFANTFDMSCRGEHYDWIDKKFPEFTKAFQRILQETK